MSRTLQGILLQTVALALFVAMDALLKVLVAHHPVAQLMFVRFVFHTLMVVLVLWLFTGAVPFRSRAPALQTLRSVALAVANAALSVSLIHIPLADATAVAFAAPVMTVACAALWLGERVSPRRWVGVGVGFLGVLVALRPPFLTGEPLHWAMLLPLVTAVAKTACRLVAIDQCRFNFLVRTSPHFARHLRQMIGERLQHSGPLGVGQFPGRSDVAGRIGDALPTSR